MSDLLPSSNDSTTSRSGTGIGGADGSVALTAALTKARVTTPRVILHLAWVIPCDFCAEVFVCVEFTISECLFAYLASVIGFQGRCTNWLVVVTVVL